MSNFLNTGRQPLDYVKHLSFVVAIGGMLLATTPLPSAAAELRSTTGERVFLDIAGDFAGWPASVSGGYTKGRIVTRTLTDGMTLKKHVGALEVEDLVVTFGVDMPQIWWDWISTELGDQAGTPRDMAAISTDFDDNTMERMVLRDAVIKQIEFPSFDRDSRELAYFKVVISASSSRLEPMSGGNVNAPQGIAKKSLQSNFRFELGDLPTQRAKTVVLPVVSIDVVKDEVGMFREPLKQVARKSVGNMTVSIARGPDEQAYNNWHDHFLIDGNVSDEDELQASLTLLGPDMQEELMKINFRQVGLVSLASSASAANREESATMDVELYIEEVALEAFQRR